jgi:hypothetical protein
MAVTFWELFGAVMTALRLCDDFAFADGVRKSGGFGGRLGLKWGSSGWAYFALRGFREMRDTLAPAACREGNVREARSFSRLLFSPELTMTFLKERLRRVSVMPQQCLYI